MKTVTTQKELDRAIADGENEIAVRGHKTSVFVVHGKANISARDSVTVYAYDSVRGVFMPRLTRNDVLVFGIGEAWS